MMSPDNAVRPIPRLAVIGTEQLIVDDLADSPAGSPIEGVDFPYNWNSLISSPEWRLPGRALEFERMTHERWIA